MKLAIFLLVIILGASRGTSNPIEFSQNDTSRLLGILFSGNRIFNDNNIQNSSITLNIIIGGEEGHDNSTRPPITGPTTQPPITGTTPTVTPTGPPTNPPTISVTATTVSLPVMTTLPTFPPIPTNPPAPTNTAPPAGLNIFNNMESPYNRNYYVRVQP
jgi:hypothetical protein